MPEYGFSLTFIFPIRTESTILRFIRKKYESEKTHIFAYFTECPILQKEVLERRYQTLIKNLKKPNKYIIK